MKPALLFTEPVITDEEFAQYVDEIQGNGIINFDSIKNYSSFGASNFFNQILMSKTDTDDQYLYIPVPFQSALELVKQTKPPTINH